MINAIVVDDEELILSEITAMVQETGFINVARAYSSPRQALQEADTIRPQVAFVDIGMPELDGITLAEKLLEKNPSLHVVFITAYNQYAVKAFELSALDYILKPINPDRFAKLVEKLAAAVSTPPRHSAGGILEIQCFGSLEVKIDGHRVKWERTKAEELFGYLLMNHGSGVHKETILDVLWPDSDPQRALPILQTLACRLRSIFAPLQHRVKLDYASSRYCLTVSESICDLFFVESVLYNSTETGGSGQLVEKAVQMVRQGFLSEHGYLWAMEKEESLKTEMCRVLRKKADTSCSKRNWADAVAPLKLLLTIKPYAEEEINLLLSCYAEMKDLYGIVEQFQWLEQVLKRDYDLEPSPSTQRLYARLSKELNKGRA